MPLSRGELGIYNRRVIGLDDVGTLVNFRLWGNIGLAVRLSATPTATTTPKAMAVAIMAMPHLLWVM